MAAGCNEVEIDPQPQTPQIDQKPTPPQTEVRIEINSLDTRSVDLTLSVTSTDMKALDSRIHSGQNKTRNNARKAYRHDHRHSVFS